jgi:hypothetical protein
MANEVLARVHASAPRRGLGVTVLASLGMMLIYLAFAAPPQHFGYQILLLAVGAAAIWLAVRMWAVTQVSIELTMDVLRLSDGTVLAPTDRIVGIDRGVFAFKPSHGFTLKLDDKMPGAWHPGMWWRLGRRLGIGGVTPGTQTKIMADIITAMIHERQPQ